MKKKYKDITEGIVHIKATFNNTIIMITDTLGNKLSQISSGSIGFRGARKSTPFAAQTASEKLIKYIKDNFNIHRISVNVSGPGPGREAAIRGLNTSGIKIFKITDKTKLPHNGCRPSKKRRI